MEYIVIGVGRKEMQAVLAGYSCERNCGGFTCTGYAGTCWALCTAMTCDSISCKLF